MKKFIGILSAMVLCLSSISSAHANTLAADPVFNPLYPDRARYQTNLFTGASEYNYPIKVPKGTDNLTPSVSLSYDSLGVRNYSIHSGMGWEVTRDYVERDANYTPGDTSDDKFKLHFRCGNDYRLMLTKEHSTGIF